MPQRTIRRAQGHYGPQMPLDPRRMLPLSATVREDSVHHAAIEEEPHSEDDALEEGFGDEEAVDDFPGKIEAEGEEGHAVGAADDGAAPEQDVAECPKRAADLEEEVADGDYVGGSVVGRDIVGAHGCDGVLGDGRK